MTTTMMMMKLGLASLTLSAQAIPVMATYPTSLNHMDGPDIPYVYNQAPPATATKKCALINIAMDESGSMWSEQAFMQNRALPDIIQTLYSDDYQYDDVFVCSSGFGYWNQSLFWNLHDYRFMGCSKGILNTDGTGGLLNSSIVDEWVSYGGWEEGYYAMTQGMDNVNRYIDGVDLNTECATLDKNMILVSDEDRDSWYNGADYTWTRTLPEMKKDLRDRGYILNVVVDATIAGDRNNVGMKITSDGAVSDSVIYRADGSSGYGSYERNDEHFTNYVANEDAIGVNTNAHYLPLIVDTAGAVWNINSLRDNSEALVNSFTKAFIEIKVQEIASITPSPTRSPTPSSMPSPVPSVAPSTSPTPAPSTSPTPAPSSAPSSAPSTSPTQAPSSAPSPAPSSAPSTSPTQAPSSSPSSAPTSGPTSAPTKAPTDRSNPTRSEIGGDPHITTWHNEHYEYHGQCDLVMLKDPQFADGLGLDIHIRTKIVRFWSFIQTVAIRIGNDILEIQGSGDDIAEDDRPHYWINYEYQGELDTMGGGVFPVTQHEVGHFVNKREYKIDLSPKYPGLSITVLLYKEFIRVKFNGNEEAFGRTVGLLGEYSTGKTLARDGVTVLDDFVNLGNEWQVLPADPKLFRQMTPPQFPELCIQPEDPRGDRKRRLSESAISVEQAQEACASLNDPLSVKDCVYDILATQDLGMVGAF